MKRFVRNLSVLNNPVSRKNRRGKAITWRRLSPIILCCFLGISLTVSSGLFVHKRETEIAHLVLEKQANAYLKTMRQALSLLVNDMQSVKRLYGLEGGMDANTFSTFLDRGMDHQDGIHALEWIARVAHSDRTQLVKDMRAKGIFNFVMRNHAKEYEIADKRDEYYPILLTEPRNLNDDSLGVDLYSSPNFRKAMQRSTALNGFYASDVEQIETDGIYHGRMRVFLPVWRGEASRPAGFVAGLIDVDDLVEAVLGDPEQANAFRLVIHEIDSLGNWNQIYNSSWMQEAGGTGASQTDVVIKAELTVAQKNWQLTFTRIDHAGNRQYMVWLVLVFGCLVTLILMWYLWASLNHVTRVEKLVAERTDSLFDANRSLRKEIAERRKAEERLFYSAYHDPLTDCGNRRSFNEALQDRFRDASTSENWRFAVLFIDLDRLKYVNDTFGHDAGDSVILETSRRLSQEIRGGDQLARLGGDEFAIILEEVGGQKSAEDVANRILNRLRTPFQIKGEQFRSSGSIGIALASDVYTHPEDLLRDADTAMYHAKSTGRNQHAVFTQDMHQRALRDISLQADLKDAIALDQFFLMYQPIYDAASGALSGFEALIRWRHPEEGLVSPVDFIRLSEELGLIHDIGEWVIRRALADLRIIQQIEGCHDLKMNINVSPLQVLRPCLLSTLKEALASNAIRPDRCQIEITESALGTSVEEMALHLEQLTQLGVPILVDDFGTEHASLSRLSQFPIRGLKVDRSFVTGMEDDETRLKLVQTLIGLKDVLDLVITAEGVENERQKQLLQELGCTYLQGYLCGRPTELGGILQQLQNASGLESSAA